MVFKSLTGRARDIPIKIEFAPLGADIMAIYGVWMAKRTCLK
jgi:hypothetical protein